MPRKKPDRSTALRSGRLKAADPFELIRWLARSQPDPRKALAELVQNSLDAGAHNVRITRRRRVGVTELLIHDDGEGVIPEYSREEALTYLATHIGHSRKRDLTPEQRRELMLQGKYGIGLLGFWSIGRTLEVRSYVPGEPALLLRLREESASWQIEPLRGRLALGDAPWTEIVIRELHAQALSSLSARRAADYLGSELRGQLLAHQAKVVVHDGIARGRGSKVVEVQPRRFEGERLVLPDVIAAGAFSPVRVELYLQLPGAAEPGRVSISQAGTVVYDHITEFSVADFVRHPWTETRLCGVIDFADFEVPPGTRRAVVLNDAAAAFLDAMLVLEPLVAACLEAERERARAELESGLMRQLQRAFREVPKRAPVYDFFEIRDPQRSGIAPGTTGNGGSGSDVDGGVVIPEAPDAATVSPVGTTDGDEEELPQMTIAGPVASAAIVPERTKVERLGTRRFRVRAFDAAGVRIGRRLDVSWQADAALGRIEASGHAVAELHAGAEPCTGEIVAIVREDAAEAVARAAVEIVEELPGSGGPRSGIPEPSFIDDPGGAWRSRMIERRWEVNSGHADFQEASETPRRKLRYLAALLAKEVVLHSFPMPSLAPALERMVEVLTITEKRLERG